MDNNIESPPSVKRPWTTALATSESSSFNYFYVVLSNYNYTAYRSSVNNRSPITGTGVQANTLVNMLANSAQYNILRNIYYYNQISHQTSPSVGQITM